MTELWLKYRDERGENQRVLVEGERFIIGRHSDCDLAIPSGKLSRQHVKIEIFAEFFIVSDCGSSNGTTLNGAELRDPVALQNGDVLNLGGGLDIEAELVSDKPAAGKRPADDDDDDYAGGPAVSGRAGGAAVSAGGGSSIPMGVLIAAPVMVIVLLLCGGGFIFFFGTGGGGTGNNGGTGSYYPTPDDTPDDTPTPRPSSTTTGGGPSVTPSPEETNTPPTPEIPNEKKKIEENSAAFLQRIAKNDPTAFLKSTEIDIISAKIAGLKGSAALANNIKAVKNNASQFQSLVKDEDLKPQFLAVAALTELGNNSGNPLEVAQRMLPVFRGLRVTLANNLADDNLLMIAAYDQGKAGKFKDLRNVLEALAKKNPSVGPREIRTIWFLKEQGKITDAEYEFALRFLAIGTITQNPKDFNVNAEAVKF
jgi:hypothetical protein